MYFVLDPVSNCVSKLLPIDSLLVRGSRYFVLDPVSNCDGTVGS